MSTFKQALLLIVIFVLTVGIGSETVYAQIPNDTGYHVYGYNLSYTNYVPETVGWTGYALDLVLESTSDYGRLSPRFEADEYVGDVALGRPFEGSAGAYIETDMGINYPVDFVWTGYGDATKDKAFGHFSIAGAPSSIAYNERPFGQLPQEPTTTAPISFSIARGARIRGIQAGSFGDFGFAAIFRVPESMKPIKLHMPGQSPLDLLDSNGQLVDWQQLWDESGRNEFVGIQSWPNTNISMNLAESLTIETVRGSLSVGGSDYYYKLVVELMLTSTDPYGDQHLPELRGSLIDKWGMIQVIYVAPINRFRLPSSVGPNQTAVGYIVMPLSEPQFEIAKSNWYYLILTPGIVTGNEFQPTGVGSLWVGG
jgi:hypothetical protein